MKILVKDIIPKNWSFSENKNLINIYYKNPFNSPKPLKLSKEIEDFYVNLGYKGDGLREILNKDKKYQKLLKERKIILTKQFKITPKERMRYVLSTDYDFEILAKCKQLKKQKLTKEDKFIVNLIQTQLEDD